MANGQKSVLEIRAKLIANGISIEVEGKEYKVEYPREIWVQTPDLIKQILLENITFGATHFLPLILNKKKVIYNTEHPFYEAFLFKNQLFDLFDCERLDKVPQLTYIKKFYNLEFDFKEGGGAVPRPRAIPKFQSKKAIAVIPFSFGKESLTTFALCRELGIKPILVYCQEPVQPYEDEYKRKKLVELQKKFGVDAYYLKYEPGMFRYGRAFNKRVSTEIGWGNQTTMLSLLMVPFVFAHQAQYILYGNEFANNEIEYINGWRVHYYYDQTSHWTIQQCQMIRSMTVNQCQVKASLEPLQEVSIFYLLHHRYPEIGKYQFSCMAENPLYSDTQWCHLCIKCARMYLFALVSDIDPKSIGFKKDLLNNTDIFKEYFMNPSDIDRDLDFAFHVLAKKSWSSLNIDQFKSIITKYIKSYNWHFDYFTALQDMTNLPDDYRDKMIKIFVEELENFKKVINLKNGPTHSN